MRIVNPCRKTSVKNRRCLESESFFAKEIVTPYSYSFASLILRLFVITVCCWRRREMKSEGWKKEKTLSRKLSSAIFELRPGKTNMEQLLTLLLFFFVDCFGEVKGEPEVKQTKYTYENVFGFFEHLATLNGKVHSAGRRCWWLCTKIEPSNWNSPLATLPLPFPIEI